LGYNAVTVTDGTLTATGGFTVTQPTVEVNPAAGVRGAQVTFTGSGWPTAVNNIVSISVGGAVRAFATPDASGNIYATFNIPAVGAGPLVVVATDSLGNTTLTGSLMVLPASITIDPVSGPPGTVITITGTGFLPLAGISSIMLGTYNATAMAGSPVTDATGGFTANISVPGLAPGGVSVSASDGGTPATAAFTITAGAAMGATPAQGFATISDVLTIAWAFDAAMQEWMVYDTAPGATSTLVVLVTGQGYFIYVSEATTLSYGSHTYNLSAGWNLIGWLG
jgi:hypothetical protein